MPAPTSTQVHAADTDGRPQPGAHLWSRYGIGQCTVSTKSMEKERRNSSAHQRKLKLKLKLKLLGS